MNRRRLLYYILLNIFISACVTSAILYWYDRNYRSVGLPQASVVFAGATAGGPTQPVPQGTVQIVSVVGAGMPAVETVTVQYTGEGQLDLSGWRLKDSAGNTFTFPAFKLFKNGAVQIHTASGTNSAIDLYWNMDKAAWQSGETAVLTDRNGKPQASYPVP